MRTLGQYWKFWMKNLALEIQTEMMYKVNLLFKIIGLVLADIVAPLITLLIYSTTPGIPGWTFEQFILFQGSFILVFGLAHLFFLTFPAKVIEAVRDGSFDKYLVKPIKPLLQLTLASWDIDGRPEAITRLALITWAMMTIGITLSGALLFILFVLIGVLFLYSLMIMIAALAFLVVKSWALYDIVFKLSDFGRYPISIYEGSLRVFLTFIFPIGIVAFYPASALLGRTDLITITKAVIPVGAVFLLSLYLWRRAMKKYTSAGG